MDLGEMAENAYRSMQSEIYGATVAAAQNNLPYPEQQPALPWRHIDIREFEQGDDRDWPPKILECRINGCSPFAQQLYEDILGKQDTEAPPDNGQAYKTGQDVWENNDTDLREVRYRLDTSGDGIRHAVTMERDDAIIQIMLPSPDNKINSANVRVSKDAVVSGELEECIHGIDISPHSVTRYPDPADTASEPDETDNRPLSLHSLEEAERRTEQSYQLLKDKLSRFSSLEKDAVLPRAGAHIGNMEHGRLAVTTTYILTAFDVEEDGIALHATPELDDVVSGLDNIHTDIEEFYS